MNSLIEKNLLKFQKPARYTGNELGIPDKDFANSKVRFALCYPDMYEIGMSNLGIKIIYDRINNLPFASCERVFSPWTDLEQFLKDNNIPLFSLETKTDINKFDFLGFSIQYELLFSNFLNILELSGLNVFADKRSDNDPIVILGGPAIVNPIPYNPFADIVLIGEGEEVTEELLTKYCYLKSNMDKKSIIKELSKINGIYSPVYSKTAVKRTIFKDFKNQKGLNNYLIPNIDIVQDKLVIEIMRGCPNKCRFCQAGVIYKPYREKNTDIILNEIDEGIKNIGINEVTFASLSSSDYSQLNFLADSFISMYSGKNISFSLPSLKVSSFDTNLLNKLSQVRKSGLTFAIETADITGQKILNKQINIKKVIKIIQNAVKHGWKLIKFYFMIGLPYIKNEIHSIKALLDDILKIDRQININVNVSVFIPKAHTPFQYEKQLDIEESFEMIHELERYFKRSRITIKKHNPYSSYIEGFIARGDEKVGMAVYDAFKNGARFDGWKEYFNKNLYIESFVKNNINYNDYLDKKDQGKPLPWDIIDIGIDTKFLLKELNRAEKNKISKSCKHECDKNCRLCNKIIKKSNASKTGKVKKHKYLNKLNIEKYRYFIEFSKINLMKFTGHMDMLRYFQKLFLRCGILLSHSQGYNPHPKIRFSSTLPLGIESASEIIEFHTDILYDEQDLLKNLLIKSHKDMPLKRIKKISIVDKSSIFDCIAFSYFKITFTESNDNDLIKINDILNNFINRKYRYSAIKKDKKIEGLYNDYIDFISMDENEITFKINTVSKTPNIIFFANDLFNALNYKIIKLNSFVPQNGNYVEIFDYYS